MNQYRLSNQAQADLDDIWLYVAQNNVEAANRLLDQILDALINLAAMPGMGHRRDDLANEALRIWNIRTYLIIYRPETRPLDIVRIVSGYRDLTTLLSNE